jgi:hypothetical protein
VKNIEQRLIDAEEALYYALCDLDAARELIVKPEIMQRRLESAAHWASIFTALKTISKQ